MRAAACGGGRSMVSPRAGAASVSVSCWIRSSACAPAGRRQHPGAWPERCDRADDRRGDAPRWWPASEPPSRRQRSLAAARRVAARRPSSRPTARTATGRQHLAPSAVESADRAHVVGGRAARSIDTSPRACAARRWWAMNAGTEPLPRSSEWSPHTTIGAVAGRLGQRCADIARIGRRGQVDAQHALRAACRTHRAGRGRRPPGPTTSARTSIPKCSPSCERDLERGLVGRRHAGEPLVVDLVGRRPLQADDDHVRRKTTPWPPSG